MCLKAEEARVDTFCLPKTLKKRKDFKNIYSKGLRTENFLIVANDYDYFRYAISVRKKEGCSVVRNKIKRRIRVILSQMNLPCVDMIFYGKKAMALQDFNELKQNITECIDKGVGII